MSKALIICYHTISSDSDLYLRSTRVEDFEKQMRYLLKNYSLIPLEDIIVGLRYGTPLTPKSIAITFDDGYRDNYENAYPILRKHNIPATIFLVTEHVNNGKILWWDKVHIMLNTATKNTLEFPTLGDARYCTPMDKKAIRKIVKTLNQLDEKERTRFIMNLADQLGMDPGECDDRRLMLSWEEVREMDDNGISFGAHTLTHPLLTKVPREQAQKEIGLSKRMIEQKLGKPVRIFAYPGGNFDIHIKGMVEFCGYLGAVTIIPGYNGSWTSRYALRRNVIGLPRGMSSLLPFFTAEVTGVVGNLRTYYHRMKGLKIRDA